MKKKVNLRQIVVLGAASGTLLTSHCFAAPAMPTNNLPGNKNSSSQQQLPNRYASPSQTVTQSSTSTVNGNGKAPAANTMRDASDINSPNTGDSNTNKPAAPFRSNSPFENKIEQQQSKNSRNQNSPFAMEEEGTTLNQRHQPSNGNTMVPQNGSSMPQRGSCAAVKPQAGCGAENPSSNMRPQQMPSNDMKSQSMRNNRVQSNSEVSFLGWGEEEKKEASKPTQNGRVDQTDRNGNKIAPTVPGQSTTPSNKPAAESYYEELSMEEIRAPQNNMAPQMNGRQMRSQMQQGGGCQAVRYYDTQEERYPQRSYESQGGYRSPRPMSMPQHSCGANGCSG